MQLIICVTNELDGLMAGGQRPIWLEPNGTRFYELLNKVELGLNKSRQAYFGFVYLLVGDIKIETHP